MKKIFLTGVYRSGTTLLDKILNTHPQIAVFSQPFSPLYFNIKKLFLKKKGIDKPYPIGPNFMDDTYSVKELSDFLNSHVITSEELDVIFEDIKNYKGELNLGLEKFRSKVKEGIFAEVFEILINLLGVNPYGKEIEYKGVKEILCEELVPDLLIKNIKSIVIIRDPRDIICSLNLGKGIEYTGEVRPLLYSLRLWRKSVAYAIKNKNDANFLFIKYEDLVLDTAKILNKITLFLNILPYTNQEYAQPLKDQNQKLWKGNSSYAVYEHIDSGSVGKYKTLLSEAAIQYIENVCFPEMKYLGYLFKNKDHDINEIISFKEPYAVSRHNFSSDFSSSKENTSMEIYRFNSLKMDKVISEEEQEKLFLFPEVYRELKKIV